MWVVKNKKDILLLFTEKPYRSDVYDTWVGGKGWCMEIVDDTFSYLTYDDEPVEVGLFNKDKQIVMSKKIYSSTISGLKKCK